VAANDGYLLKNFVAAGIPVSGHRAHRQHRGGGRTLGIPVLREFFGESTGQSAWPLKAGKPI
jgi:hypothetical protein